MVLVHGIRSSASMWRRQREALTARGTAHRAVDMPGHGSRAEQQFDLAGCRAVLDGAVADLPGPHVVVGHSLGAYVALDWAARSARPPAALLLASCGIRPRGPGLAGYIRVASLIGRLPDRGLALHTAMAHRVLGPDAPDVLAGGAGLGAMVPALHAVGSIDVVSDLERLEIPVWFVNGAHDHFRVEERRLLRAARYGTLVVVPGAGHLLPLDRPAVFDAVVQDAVEHAAA